MSTLFYIRFWLPGRDSQKLVWYTTLDDQWLHKVQDCTGSNLNMQVIRRCIVICVCVLAYCPFLCWTSLFKMWELLDHKLLNLGKFLLGLPLSDFVSWTAKVIQKIVYVYTWIDWCYTVSQRLCGHFMQEQSIAISQPIHLCTNDVYNNIFLVINVPVRCLDGCLRW